MEERILLAKRMHLKTNNILHLILSVFTGGLWIPVWMLVALSNAIERGKIDKKLRGVKWKMK